MMIKIKYTNKLKDILYPLVTFLVIIIVWQFIVDYFDIKGYIMPSPSDIIKVFYSDFNNLFKNTLITLNEATLGFILAIVFSILIGTLMDFIPIFKKCFYPIFLVSQTIPTITIAPILIIWFGFDSLPKIIMVTITCFFPILISFIDGISNIDKDYLNLFKTMNASKIDTFIHLKFPMALNNLFSGLKISATYAFVSATVAEWLGGSQGLGVYMIRAKSSYALDKVFASTIIVIIFSLIFVFIIEILKKLLYKERELK